MEAESNESVKPGLKELAQVFFRLGAIAFGGPAAHIAMMDDEIVQRRGWMKRENLLDLMGVTSLLPGPNSTELAIHIGYEQRGWSGLFVAGSCFIFPAMAIVWLLAILYVRTQTVPQFAWLLYGIKPVIIAIVLRAVGKLGKKAVKDLLTGVAGVLALAAYFARFNEVLILLLLGITVMLVKNWQNQPKSNNGVFILPLSGILAQTGGITNTVSLTWGTVFFFFFKIGCVLYGSGYVLLAFLQRDLVENNQWLTSQQLLDAVAIGQITPGPVLTTATFVGYLLAGNSGAIAGTLGIFLPAFLLVGLVNPWVAKIRRSPWAGSFLDGVNAASLGLMAGVTLTLGQAALIDWLTAIMAILSAIAVFKFRVKPIWLVFVGGAISFVAHLWGLVI
ncbi:MAG: chromate efflux transporter [Cyanobacteria bacterium P01_C01_bin.72]